ncbi:hypothetical protein PF002_g21431 [Phytophthora fragariae]|uniref:Uncharacterized protein n=1 Tax=Phytophthora fragariae TaxID=53985 RepID=A0A6A3SHG1_9STRA|nr:hypothetical protein PF009_g21087 [Phytophthora fragariae]KAE9087876.1 hypothetical protein PF007_g20203 [Phytophthora fragariae]KAE9116275.1 hypothetical protein PF006_g19082 [Phytophthora fragariae]KAE9201795.1 hypothetical protein PF002_g21431 [Phytophthora fragariae]KAE9291238.1 hypothetical protein PF001_g19251 [Phytophthora fragariae]
MEPFTCATCAAQAVPPPLTPDGLGLELRQCGCCEALVAYDAFARPHARPGACPCIACANGPNAQVYWHRDEASAPAEPEPDERQQRLALVTLLTMSPSSSTPPPLPPRKKKQCRKSTRGKKKA